MFFGVNGMDFSYYVSGLKVSTNTNYNAQTNAAGDTVVDYVNKKKVIDVTFIPLDVSTLKSILYYLKEFSITVDYLNPETNKVEHIECISPSMSLEYHMLTNTRKFSKPFTMQFVEL